MTLSETRALFRACRRAFKRLQTDAVAPQEKIPEIQPHAA